jgi:hypothetical protein
VCGNKKRTGILPSISGKMMLACVACPNHEDYSAGAVSLGLSMGEEQFHASRTDENRKMVTHADTKWSYRN